MLCISVYMPWSVSVNVSYESNPNLYHREMTIKH